MLDGATAGSRYVPGEGGESAGGAASAASAVLQCEMRDEMIDLVGD